MFILMRLSFVKDNMSGINAKKASNFNLQALFLRALIKPK